MKGITIIIIIVIFSYSLTGISSTVASAARQANGTEASAGTLAKASEKFKQLSNQYIVTMKQNASTSDIEHVINLVKEKGGQVLQVYKHAIRGFSMTVPRLSANNTVAELAADPRVVKVEHDVEVHIAKKN